jgi:hypothetical protein
MMRIYHDKNKSKNWQNYYYLVLADDEKKVVFEVQKFDY